MDFNRDGKVNAKDSAIYHEVINKESKSINSYGNYNTNHNYSNNADKSACPQTKIEIKQLGRIVLIFVVIMLLLMLITGAGVKVLVNMIEIGLIMFLAAQWFDS